MPYEWNPAKRDVNLSKHGIDFHKLDEFEWHRAIVEADTRFDHGEVRLRTLGLIDIRVHVLIYTIRRTSTWIINLRKANKKESLYYAEEDSHS